MARKNQGNGGIFGGKNALGLASFGATSVSCTPDNVELIKKVQKYLKANGAPNLHVDGQWQGCTSAAYSRIMGKIFVTCEDIAMMTGETCSSNDCISTPFGGGIFGFTAAGINQCTDRTDGPGTAGGDNGVAPKQQCGAGMCWYTAAGKCMPEMPFMAGNTPGCDYSGQTAPPNAMPCPEGTQLIGGACVATGAPTGSTCPSGQLYVPLLGCQQNLIGGGQPANQPPAGQPCPQGQINVPIMGCVQNVLDPNTGKTTTGQPSTGNPITDAFCQAMPTSPGCPQTTQPKPAGCDIPLLGGLIPGCSTPQPGQPATPSPVCSIFPGMAGCTNGSQPVAPNAFCDVPLLGGYVPGCPPKPATPSACASNQISLLGACITNPFAPPPVGPGGVPATSFWGSYGVPIAAALAVGAGALYLYAKNRGELPMEKAIGQIEEGGSPVMDAMMDDVFGDALDALGGSGGELTANRRRRHGKGRKRSHRR